MKRRWTRREFVEEAARRSAGVGVAGMLLPTLSCVRPDDRVAALGIDERVLTGIMDAFIPAEGEMPSASAAGVLDYLRRLAPRVSDVSDLLAESVARIDAAAREGSGSSFSDLAPDDRVAVLERVEAESPDRFGELVTLVYEGYYVQPVVWEAIGYEPYPTGGGGPTLEPFDPALLERVAGQPASYREAD